MKWMFLLVLALLINSVIMSQNSQELNINITPLVENESLQLSESTKDSITIETLKFYLTNFSFTKSGEKVWEEDNSYHLIDASQSKSLTIQLNLPEKIEFDEIHFLLGTDSLTNVSGVMGGDLDPTKGMYWAWNSGYINFKLEGKRKSTPFEFHLGGYAPPFKTVQKIDLKTTATDNLNVYLNIAGFLNQLDLAQQHKIMSPGKEAQRLSKIVSTLFYINE